MVDGHHIEMADVDTCSEMVRHVRALREADILISNRELCAAATRGRRLRSHASGYVPDYVATWIDNRCLASALGSVLSVIEISGVGAADTDRAAYWPDLAGQFAFMLNPAGNDARTDTGSAFGSSSPRLVLGW